MKKPEMQLPFSDDGCLSKSIRGKVIAVIEEKLNKEKHGYIKLSVSKGKIVKISWEAGETIKEEN